ncbi:hypothetical protein [Alkalinema sp. FACHB-956]|uniref:hypothetical protein n=1 Tax=Alkalinema sp. FACHB-956 TaxID=2692768 RepID=UPI0016882096|nr:hypothetical protein [Alkalinema sp. FACHB-956]MBD2327480.1 hypothetical protein [Alkalinema sp. FACHB-956]
MMKRMVFIGLGLLGTMCSGLAIAYQQATSLPAGYENPAQNPLPAPDTLQAAAQPIEQKLRSLNSENSSVSLSPAEVKVLVAATISQISQQVKASTAIKGVHTTLENQQLQAGAVVDLAELQQSQLSRQEKALLQDTIQRIPGFQDRQIYLGISGKPRIVHGQIQLDPETQVKVGNLSFSLQQIAQRVGVPPEQIQAQINRTLPQFPSEMSASSVEVENDRVVIRRN